MMSDLVKQIACMWFLSTCVSAYYGPENCTKREYFDPDYIGCYPDCEVPVVPDWDCAQSPEPACLCKEKYLKAANGICVLPINCPVRDCPTNEHFVKATTKCELSCAEPVIAPGCFIKPISKCVCNKHKYRNDDYLCVPFKNCTSDSEE